MFENGEELSGGQWQKIALARAFMRDARLMILDEPASSLDADSEYEIFKNFKALLGQKIAVLISHRFSTVKMADKIIVLQAGRICEQGSHTDLLRKNGPYASWFEMQKSVSGLG
jgi:ATP-binding cassette subfamily B protein